MRIDSESTARVLLFVLLLPAAVAGCAGRETPVEIGNREQVLHRGIGSEPRGLDPHIVTGVTEFSIMSSLIEGLVAPDPIDVNVKPVPGVAENWEISEDEQVYTFHLRKDAVWSNGDAVTAGDFVFSFKRILSPALGSEYAYMLFCMKNGEAYNKGTIIDFDRTGARAVDDHTLEITLESPTKYFLSLINHHSWYPVHPPTILKHGRIDQRITRWTEPGNYVGNGAFVLTTWQPNKKIVVEKSKTYWDRDTGRLREIHFYPIGDHKVEERSFRAGQLHVTETMPLDRIRHYQEKAPELLRLDPYLGVYYYLFNVTHPPLDDVRVRKALAMAVDREKIVKYVTKGGEDPAYCFTPPNTAGYTARAGLEADPEKAGQLLAEAGYPNGSGFPKLRLLYNTSDAHQRVAEVIHQMWKKTLNIEIELVNTEWKVYLTLRREGKYDISRAGWIGDYIDPNTFLDMWITGRGNNHAGWSNKEYDELLARAASTLDESERYDVFQKAEQILIDEMPVLPIYFYRSKTLVQPSVRGWNSSLLDIHPYKHVYLE